MRFIFYLLIDVLLLTSILIVIVGTLWVIKLIVIEWVGFDYVKWIKERYEQSVNNRKPY